MVRRRSEVLVVQWQGQLHLPGGAIGVDEATLAAHRECLEEIGWRIRVEGLGALRRYLYASLPARPARQPAACQKST